MKTKRVVLLIDDCQIDNFVNKKMIQNCSFAETVLEFRNPLRGLDYLKSLENPMAQPGTLPDLIFLDLNMPVLDGDAFLNEYEKLSETIHLNCKIVVLSGAMDPRAYVSSVRNKHVIAVMHKPLIKMNFDYLETLLGSPHDHHSNSLKI